MKTWYLKQLGDRVAALGTIEQIQNAFFAFVSTKAESGHDYSNMAIFSQNDFHSNATTVYFSPEAEMLAKAFQAEICEKPSPTENFGLLVGDASSLDYYFPELFGS